MDTPLRSLRNTSIDARRDRRMPRAQVQTMMVRQPVSLKPMGNTVAMTVPAEMPFVGRNITVQTQVSGGMARPDRSQMSRRLRGTFSGLGAELPRGSMSRATARNITMDDQSKYDPALWDEAEAIIGGTMLASDDAAPAGAPAEESSFSWSKAGDIFSTVANAGVNIYGKVQDAKKQPGGITNVANYTAGAPKKSNMNLYLILGGVGLVGLLAFLIIKRKSGASTAA